jgi:hypothetical protein
MHYPLQAPEEAHPSHSTHIRENRIARFNPVNTLNNNTRAVPLVLAMRRMHIMSASITLTTPSTPINDAHQEGYSFIDATRHFLTCNGIQRRLDASTLSGVVYSHQHLPHLSTMCTTGGFFLPQSQQMVDCIQNLRRFILNNTLHAYQRCAPGGLLVYRGRESLNRRSERSYQ